MPFIGIIAEAKHEEYLQKSIFENIREKVNIQLQNIISINTRTVENVKNIKFETILIHSDKSKVFQNLEQRKKILGNARFLIVNSDLKMNLDIVDNVTTTSITYGLNQKATVTASSMEEENVFVCIQRTMKSIYNQEIEPQELKITPQNREYRHNIYNILAITTIALLYGNTRFLIQ